MQPSLKHISEIFPKIKHVQMLVCGVLVRDPTNFNPFLVSAQTKMFLIVSVYIALDLTELERDGAEVSGINSRRLDLGIGRCLAGYNLPRRSVRCRHAALFLLHTCDQVNASSWLVVYSCWISSAEPSKNSLATYLFIAFRSALHFWITNHCVGSQIHPPERWSKIRRDELCLQQQLQVPDHGQGVHSVVLAIGAWHTLNLVDSSKPWMLCSVW